MARCCSRAMRKWSSLLNIPNTVVGQRHVHISFHVYIENEILCHEPGMSAVIFLSLWNLWKSVSLMDISRNPSNYLPRMLLFIVIVYLIIEYFMICARWVHSPCPQNLYVFRTDCGKKSKISLCKSYGNQFLNRAISFSLRKATRWKIYLRQPQNSLTLLSVKIAADQLGINYSSVSFRWIQVCATGEY